MAIPYIQLYPADYLADTQHLTTEQHGAYLLLIMNYFQTGERLKPARLPGITRLSPEAWDEIEPILREFFDIDEDGCWVHKRIEKELLIFRRKSEVRREAAMKAVGKRGRKPAKTTKANKTPKTPDKSDTSSKCPANDEQMLSKCSANAQKTPQKTGELNGKNTNKNNGPEQMGSYTDTDTDILKDYSPQTPPWSERLSFFDLSFADVVPDPPTLEVDLRTAGIREVADGQMEQIHAEYRLALNEDERQTRGEWRKRFRRQLIRKLKEANQPKPEPTGRRLTSLTPTEHSHEANRHQSNRKLSAAEEAARRARLWAVKNQ